MVDFVLPSAVFCNVDETNKFGLFIPMISEVSLALEIFEIQ